MKQPFYIVALLMLLMHSCANPVAPTGGEKDITAPVIQVVHPINGAINYKGDKIEFIFDEYIVYSSALDKVLITPPMPEKPKILAKGKKIILKLPQNLPNNTTYNISFLGAITDYNEGNSLDILKFVFSTGNYIDSGSISGYLKDAYTRKNIENITVGLYSLNDTDVLIKSKPLYLTQTDVLGQFTINYIKEGEYVIAALEDQNLNFTFDQVSEKISIPTNPILIQKNTVLEQDLVLFSNESNAFIEEYKILNNNTVAFIFSKEIETILLDVEPYFESDVVKLNYNNDTLFYHWSNDTLETAKFFFNIDNQTKDTIKVNFLKNKITENISIEKNKLPVNNSLVIIFPLLIKNINEKLIEIQDSSDNKLDYTFKIVENTISFKANLKENQNYKLLIDSNAIKYFNLTNNVKRNVYFFETIEPVEKGDLLLNFTSSYASKLILELLNNSETKIRQYDISNLNSLKIENLIEGSYFIRIYEDINNNEKWDTGSLENLIEPEKTLFYSPKIEMKQNWDKDLSISF